MPGDDDMGTAHLDHPAVTNVDSVTTTDNQTKRRSASTPNQPFVSEIGITALKSKQSEHNRGHVVRRSVGCCSNFTSAHNSLSPIIAPIYLVFYSQHASITPLLPFSTMTTSKTSGKSAAASKKKSTKPSAKDATLAGPQLYHKTGNSWQDVHCHEFLVSKLVAYKRKALQRKGREFATQCADQYFKENAIKCKEMFDPSLGPNEEIKDIEGWKLWKLKRTQVRSPHRPCFGSPF
jgi:hypothetical protein